MRSTSTRKYKRRWVIVSGYRSIESQHEALGCGRRWPVVDLAPCGILAFDRPCKLLSESEREGGNFPDHPVCKGKRELVLVVEDEDDLRADLVELISGMGHAAIGCKDAAEFEKNFASADTGCLVLDVRLQGGDGISVLERAKDMGSALPAIMLTGVLDPSVAADCIKIGAVEYLVKPANELRLRRVIQAAVSLSRSQFCRKQSKISAQKIVELLTPAEEVVANFLAKGLTTKQIAGLQGRSENTVKIHRHKVMKKIGINSVASIANLYNYLSDGERDIY